MSRSASLLVAPALAALAATAAFADHPRDFAKAATPVILQNSIADAERVFLKEAEASGRNQLLYLYELAGLYHLAGACAKSAALLDQADAVARLNERRAVLTGSGAIDQAGAALTNDTILPWEGAVFDKVMARTLNALNYLARNDLEGARVEVRKAEEYQIRERERTQAKVDAAAARNLAAPGFSARYGRMFDFAAQVRNSYENAFTYYLSSQIYRAHGRAGLDDALQDIRRAYSLAPDAPAIQAAYLELAAQNAQDPDGLAALAELKARFAAGPDWTPADPAASGNIVVIYEAGLAPRLSEVAVDLVLPMGGLFSMAFPIYNEFGEVQAPLTIRAPAVARTTTRVLDIRPLAVRSLKERIPALITRGVAGGVAKLATQKEAEHQLGPLGGLFAKVVTKAVTNADLRSWLSLPSEVQAAQFALPPGPSDLTLAAHGWSERVALNVVPGATTFITVRGVGGHKSITTATILSPDAAQATANDPHAVP